MPEQPGHAHMQPMPGTCVVVERETRVRMRVGLFWSFFYAQTM